MAILESICVKSLIRKWALCIATLLVCTSILRLSRKSPPPPYIAKRIYKPKHFTKAIVNDYKSMLANPLGPFYEPKSFDKAVQEISLNPQYLYLLNVAMIESMKHFTKDNGLVKELYIFASNPTPPDSFRAQTLLSTMKSLNRNITQGKPELAINQVVFHSLLWVKKWGFCKA